MWFFCGFFVGAKPMFQMIAFIVVLYCIAAPSLVEATEPRTEDEHAEETEVPWTFKKPTKTHFLGLRGDFGTTKQWGLGYVYAQEWGLRHHTLWHGYGADLRFITGNEGDVGILVYGVHRMSLGFGFGTEIASGIGWQGDDLRWAGSLGLYGSAHYVEFGYTFQFPLNVFDRPDWLGGHFFSIRVHIPIIGGTLAGAYDEAGLSGDD
ncbi:MAG: hypothetical protein ACNA8W_17380 [Bradymonadaceae bacterium]